MLSENDIKQALHASRVVPLSVTNPHGPLGLEQLAAAVARISGLPEEARIRRPISFSIETWQKLEALAQASTQNQAQPVTPSELATAIVEQFLAANASPPR